MRHIDRSPVGSAEACDVTSYTRCAPKCGISAFAIPMAPSTIAVWDRPNAEEELPTLRTRNEREPYRGSGVGGELFPSEGVEPHSRVGRGHDAPLRLEDQGGVLERHACLVLTACSHQDLTEI